MNNRAKVAKLIWEAFPQRTRRELSHEDAVKLREELCTLLPEDFHFYLPELLVDILTEQSNEAVPANIQWVIDVLDINPSEDYGWERQAFGVKAADYSLQSRMYLSEQREEATKDFSVAEAHAVYEWLTEIRTWSQLKTWTTEIESATTYWKRRSGTL